MYKIIGTDGKEYGPVAADLLQRWIAEGRVTGASKVQREGETEWKSLSELTEFTEALRVGRTAPRRAITPPVLPNQSIKPHRLSRLALGSMGIMMLAFLCLLPGVMISSVKIGLAAAGSAALLGVIMGTVAMIVIKQRKENLRGFAYALSAVIGSVLCLVIIPVIFAIATMMLPGISMARQSAHTAICANNLKQLSLAAHVYADGHNGRLPEATNWCDAISAYVGNPGAFQCPAGDISLRCHFAFNTNLGGADIAKINPGTVLFFETEGGWNVSGGQELLISKSRHSFRIPFRAGSPINPVVIAFADGSVQQRIEPLHLHWLP